MKKEIAMQWVAALRSGDYKQGRSLLRNSDDAFCCLGVLCNLHAQAHPEEAKLQTDLQRYYGFHDELPPTVRAWSGMEKPLGARHSTGLTPGLDDTLADLNDTGYSFAQIADVIEQEWEML
jgi:hypothetical protein